MIFPNRSVEGTIKAAYGVSHYFVIQRNRGLFGKSLLPACFLVDLLEFTGEKGRWLSRLILHAVVELGLIFWSANIMCLTGLSSDQTGIAKRVREQLLLSCGAVKKGTLLCVAKYKADWIFCFFC